MTWPMLTRLSQSERDSLLAAAQVRRFRNREVLFRAGDTGDAMFLIQDGYVSVRIVTQYGDESTLVVLGPGDTVGELALLSPGQRRGATVIAIADTTAWVLTRAQLDALREQSRDVDRLLIELLRSQVQILTEQLIEARYVPVRHRVARVLVRLCGERHPVPGAPVDLVITQDDVAGLTGAARPGVNQALRGLESAGAIELRRGRIRVTDDAELARHTG